MSGQSQFITLVTELIFDKRAPMIILFLFNLIINHPFSTRCLMINHPDQCQDSHNSSPWFLSYFSTNEHHHINQLLFDKRAPILVQHGQRFFSGQSSSELLTSLRFCRTTFSFVPILSLSNPWMP